MSNEISTKPRILVNAPTMSGLYEVFALHEAGYPLTLITSLCFSNLDWLPSGNLFQPLHNLLSRRLYPDLDDIDTHRILLPEVIARMASMMGVSQSKRHFIQNTLFDHAALNRVPNYDVFHFLSGVGLVTSRKAKRLGIKVVLSERAVHVKHELELLVPEFAKFEHQYDYYGATYLERTLEQYELADRIIVLSRYAARTFEEYGLGHKVTTINLSFKTSQFSCFHSPFEMPDRTFRVLYVGSMIPRKGVHYLIEAFRKANLPDAELWLVGSVHPSLGRVIGELKPPIYHFRHMPQSELAEMYRKASVFVLPSLTDSWGFVVLEAMASGLPVIVTENTGAKDAVRPGVDGYVVPIRDPDAIAEKLQLLYNAREQCLQMGQNAAEHAGKFGYEQYQERFSRAYANLLTRMP